MIYGIGIDLVNIKRVERVIERWGDRFIGRVFTPDEIAFCYKRAFPISAFALRFAAKEAFSKALGLGMRRGIRWKDIEIFHFPQGQPYLKLRGRSSDICREKRITSYHLSLSDEGEYGIAMVVLEKSDETG
ncbi:MAG: holo-ACP synthase [Deltaproteobacteria bacterium]|nr:MAG: holo-ACP synthase [Deltaproteobacteria bacterium]